MDLKGEPISEEFSVLNLARAFLALQNLFALHLGGSTTVAKVLLSRQVCERGLRALEHLTLANAFPQPATFPSSFYANLYLLPLSTMTLNFGSQSPLPHTTNLNFPELTRPVALTLRGPLTNPALAEFVRHCPNLSKLCLVDTSDSSHFIQHGIPAPDYLPFLLAAPTLLILLQIGHWEEPPSVGQQHPLIDDALRRFTDLQSLYIGANATSETLFDSVLQDPLPLAALGFGHYSSVRDSDVISILVGSKKLSSLKYLVMDNLSAEEGPMLGVAGTEPEFLSDGQVVIPEGWALADWGVEFTYEGAQELARAAEQEEVELGGSLLDAVDVEERWGSYLELVQEWKKKRLEG